MITSGRVWGNGQIIFWQVCPVCGKKKMYWERKPWPIGEYYWCTWCKKTIEKKEDYFVRRKYGKD